jgi:hypothetical protein
VRAVASGVVPQTTVKLELVLELARNGRPELDDRRLIPLERRHKLSMQAVLVPAAGCRVAGGAQVLPSAHDVPEARDGMLALDIANMAP